MNKTTIKSEDIKVRRSWGQVKPFTRKFKDHKKEQNRQKCRGKVRHEA